MKSVEVYAKVFDPEWGYALHPVNLTGRWKIMTINGDKELYVEHKGWLIRNWYSAEDIQVFDIEETINECHH